MEILTETGPDAQKMAAFVEQKLLSSLAKTNIQSKNANVVLSVRDGAGNLTGGITASASYGWLLIKTLWVEEENRGAGIGRHLVEAMHCAGKKIDCHAVWLDTSSKDAMKFYSGLGYEVFGVLENTDGQIPETHKRWFMKKTCELSRSTQCLKHR